MTPISSFVQYLATRNPELLDEQFFKPFFKTAVAALGGLAADNLAKQSTANQAPASNAPKPIVKPATPEVNGISVSMQIGEYDPKKTTPEQKAARDKAERELKAQLTKKLGANASKAQFQVVGDKLVATYAAKSQPGIQSPGK